MDFVGCPGGSFMMGKPGDADPKSATFEHKVTITRPFWMGKFPVTVEQWTSVMGRLNLSEAQKAMGPKMPVNMNRADVMTLALKLTRMNQNKLPKGYVIRLPSEAEWEYAVRANSTDPDDPYAWIRGGGRKFDGEWDKYRTSTKDILAFLKGKGIEFSYNEKQKKRMAQTGQSELPFFGKIFGCVGEHQPNAWGIHDVFHGRDGCETVLDTVSASVQSDFFRKDRSEYFFKDEDSDPLNYAGERKIHAIMLNDGPKMHSATGHPKILFRLVIGPDLLKERGIKLPDLGK